MAPADVINSKRLQHLCSHSHKHKAGVTDDIHTKSHITNTLTPAPSHIQVNGAAEASSDKRDTLASELTIS